MPESSVSVEVHPLNERANILHIRGEVTAASQDAVIEAYERASTDTTKSVLLDFTGLEYVNSSGIGLLSTLLIRANRQRQRVVAYGLKDQHRHILGLARLDDAMDIYGSEEEARAALGG
jgi:anti-sigma B factor antagonist